MTPVELADELAAHGLKIVSRELTEDMHEASWGDGSGPNGMHVRLATRAWRAMFDAAPSVPDTLKNLAALRSQSQPDNSGGGDIDDEVEDLERFLEAYPLDIFPEPTPEQMAVIGYGVADRIGASMGRHCGKTFVAPALAIIRRLTLQVKEGREVASTLDKDAMDANDKLACLAALALDLRVGTPYGQKVKAYARFCLKQGSDPLREVLPHEQEGSESLATLTRNEQAKGSPE